MAHYINASEICEILVGHEIPGGEAIAADIEVMVQKAAEALAAHYGIEITMSAETSPGLGGLCVGFGPKFKGQQIPEDIMSYDNSDWAASE